MRKIRISAGALYLRRAGALCLCAAAALTLTGCVPLPVVDSYHQVSADEGQVNGNCLEGNLGPPSRLEFDRGQVHIKIDGNDLSGFTSRPYVSSLRITFEMPLDTVVTFDPDGLKVIDSDSGRPVQVRSTLQLSYREGSLFGRYLWLRDVRNVSDQGDLDPAKNAIDPLSGSTVAYTDELDFSGEAPRRFDLILPGMKIGGTSYPGLPVRFQHGVGAFCVFLLFVNYDMRFIR